jgi:hypothetical protein
LSIIINDRLVCEKLGCTISSKKFTNIFQVYPFAPADSLLLWQLISHSFLYKFYSTNEDKMFDNKARIFGMHQGGAKGVEIVAALGHPKSIVSTILKEFECRRSVEHPTGCPQKLSEKSVRIITRKLV